MANFFDQFDTADVPRITVTPGRGGVPAVGRALLDAIAGSESPGYNVTYGGGTFDDFSDHPRRAVPITRGPNAGKTSSAAGRYQFLGSTWDEVKRDAGLPDFSPESQDQGAWHLAQKTYKAKTGRDLAQDLESAKGNPNAVAGIGRMLSGTWTSLPGGSEPNSQTMAFADRFDRSAGMPTEFSAQRRGGNFFDQFDTAAPPSSGAERPPDPVSAFPDTGGRFTDTAGQNFRTAREGISPTVATKGEAFERGLGRAATFNFLDELNAVAEAGGHDPNNRDALSAAIGLIKGAYLKATGDKDAENTYRAAVSRERETDTRMQEQQPGASLGGEVVGSLATVPFTGGAGVAARGAGLGARAVQGAKAGGVMGALSGAGEGTDLQSRATGAATGGVTGGLVGAAAVPAVEGVVQAGRGIAAAARPITTAIRGIRDPEAEAARRVVGAIQRDAQAAGPGNAPGMTAAEFAADRAAGGPASIMDLGGETTRGLARSAANTSPEGRAALNRSINDRFESQSERVSGWLNQTFGPSDTGATREALQDAARRANRPAYARAYRDGDVPLWTPELQRLAGSPDVVDAMRAAAEKGKSRAITDGFGGFNSSVQISPTGVVEFARGKNGQPTYPNLQFWDYTKRALDDAANAARRAGRNDEASVLGQLATGLRNELDANVPSYQAARAGAARFFGANDALEAGERFLASKAPMPDLQRAWGALSPPERDLFREGFVQSLVQRLESRPDRRNVLNIISDTPRMRAQMELVMGPQRAREFEAMMRVEGIMDLARGAVQGNSTTARQLTELGLAGGAYGVGAFGSGGLTDPSALTSAALVWGAARGKGVIDQRVAQQVARMLTSNDPAVLRRGINMVSRNQSMLNALRSFDTGLARVGGQQSTGVPALQSLNPSRAEDQ